MGPGKPRLVADDDRQSLILALATITAVAPPPQEGPNVTDHPQAHDTVEHDDERIARRPSESARPMIGTPRSTDGPTYQAS